MNRRLKSELLPQRAVFLEKGMAGARMQDIADRAGINKALLHYYFRSKDKLFLIIFREAVHAFLPQIQTLFTTAPDLPSLIRGFVQTYMSMLANQPYLAPFIIHEINHNPKNVVGDHEPARPGSIPD